MGSMPKKAHLTCQQNKPPLLAHQPQGALPICLFHQHVLSLEQAGHTVGGAQ